MRLLGVALCVAFLSFLLPPSPLPPGTVEAATRLRVHGYVRDATTGAGIASAIVTASGPVGVGIQTGGWGSYSLELPAGRYTVTAALAGYADQSKQLVLKKQSAQVNFRLHPQTNSKGPVPTSPPPPAGNAIPATLFNATYFDGRNDPVPPVLTTGSLGKGVGVIWHYVQPSSACPSSPCTSFDWSQVDVYTALAAAHGVDWFYDFDTTVRWAVANTSTCGTNGNSADTCTGMVAHLSDWTNYVTALVQRYDGTTGHGRILIYEMWNEPENPEDWTDTTANLAVLAKEAVRIIRANDAAKGIHSIITTPSGSANFLGSFMSAYITAGGSASDFDAVSLHAYYGTTVCGSLPAPCAEAIIADAASMKAAAAAHGLAGKPLLDTEGGSYGISGSNLVAFVARWHLLHWSFGISRMMWYAADIGGSSYGTLLASQNPPVLNSAGVAYNQVYDWMVGAAMNTPCAATGTVWTCGLKTSAGVQTLAVWNTAGSSSYTVPSGYGHYKDLAGNTNAISGGTVRIGIQPVLLTP